MRIQPKASTPQDLLSQRGPISKYSCPRHKVEYFIAGSARVECPVCQLEEVVRDLRPALQEANNKIEILEKEVDKYRARVDSAYAMASSIDLLDADDRTFLKAVLYRWRED